MPKPQWLREKENIKNRVYKMCVDCEHFGKPIKNIRYKSKENCMLHECEIHPGCMNTRFSIGCEDWSKYVI